MLKRSSLKKRERAWTWEIHNDIFLYMNARYQSEKYLKELVQVLAQVDDIELLENFLKSLLTPYEVEEIATRWALVRLIDQGMSQRNISKELGLSLCKITRGSKELKKKNSSFKKMVRLYDSLKTTETK